MAFSVILSIDQDIETLLQLQCEKMDLNTKDAKEVALRMKQNVFPNGNREYFIDDQLCLTVRRNLITENAIDYLIEVHEVKPPTKLLVPGKGRF